MGNGSELKSKGAKALRAAGYLPLPRLWVTADQMDLVQYMARQNADEVNRIRAEANCAGSSIGIEDQIEEAWRRHRESG